MYANEYYLIHSIITRTFPMYIKNHILCKNRYIKYIFFLIKYFLILQIHQPLGISIFENSLYWLMGSNGQIQKCKLYANRLCEIMDIGSSNIHKHFAILHVSRHPLG